VYDVTNEKSFESLDGWIRNIHEHADPEVECIIIGNKCDMSRIREVSREKGEKVSRTPTAPMTLDRQSRATRTVMTGVTTGVLSVSWL
jgi:GTPase SAR1 family protein